MHRSCPACKCPGHQISANLFSSEDTSALGGGVELADGNKKEKAHLALTK